MLVLIRADFERIGEMFSPDDEEMTNFRFFVYDEEGKGYITRQDLTKMFRTCFETNLKIREQDLEKLVKEGQAEKGALENFNKAKEMILSKNDVIDNKIKEAVNYAFETAVREEPEKITKEEFGEANAKNDDSFDWRVIADDLCDYVDDYAKLVE